MSVKIAALDIFLWNGECCNMEFSYCCRHPRAEKLLRAFQRADFYSTVASPGEHSAIEIAGDRWYQFRFVQILRADPLFR